MQKTRNEDGDPWGLNPIGSRVPGNFGPEAERIKGQSLGALEYELGEKTPNRAFAVTNTRAENGALLVEFSDGTQVKTWWKPCFGYGRSGDQLDGEEPQLTTYQREALRRYFPDDQIG